MNHTMLKLPSLCIKLRRAQRMTRKILYLFLLFQFYGMQATWIVDWITNQSDLKFVQAARDNDVEIQSVSKKLQDTPKLKTTKLGEKARFGTVGGCKIIAQDPQGQTVTIRFLADATHRVASGRAPDADLDSRKAAGAENKGMMARIIFDVQGAKKLIGYYCGYEKEKQQFKLVLKGSGGNYHVDLTPIASK